MLTLVQEALLTSAAGALLGTVLGLILLRGAAVRLAMGAFGLSVDAQVVALALLGGLLLGAAGALPPAWRCLRTPIAEGLRQA